MKSTYDPSIIEIGICEPVNLQLKQDPFWFPSEAENYAVRFNMQRSTFPSIESSTILIIIRVDAIAETAKKEEVAHYSSTFRFGFSIDSLEDFLNFDAADQVVDMHQGLLANITSIALSSLRGLLRGIYANTIFAPFILPAMTPQQIGEMKNVDFQGMMLSEDK